MNVNAAQEYQDRLAGAMPNSTEWFREVDNAIAFLLRCEVKRTPAAPDVAGGVEEEPLHDAETWCRLTGWKIMDPDGWDRRNFDESWAERITEAEFVRRASMSTAMPPTPAPQPDEGGTVEAFIAEVEGHVADWRRLWPEPHKLSANLALLVRACDLLRTAGRVTGFGPSGSAR